MFERIKRLFRWRTAKESTVAPKPAPSAARPPSPPRTPDRDAPQTGRTPSAGTRRHNGATPPPRPRARAERAPDVDPDAAMPIPVLWDDAPAASHHTPSVVSHESHHASHADTGSSVSGGGDTGGSFSTD